MYVNTAITYIQFCIADKKKLRVKYVFGLSNFCEI